MKQEITLEQLLSLTSKQTRKLLAWQQKKNYQGYDFEECRDMTNVMTIGQLIEYLCDHKQLVKAGGVNEIMWKDSEVLCDILYEEVKRSL